MITLIKEKDRKNNSMKLQQEENVLGKNIRRLLKEKGYTQQEFAEKVGISRVYLSDLIRGKKGKRIPQSTLNKIAKALGVSVSELLRTPEEKKERLNEVEEITDTVVLPVVSDVPAGGFQGGDVEIVDYLPVPRQVLRGVPREYAAWWVVSGNSMAPEINPGDVVLVADGSWVEIHNGDRVIAVYDKERTLKRFYDKGEYIVLQPVNDKDHEPIVIKKDELKNIPLYLYKVLAVLKKY